MVTSPRLGSAQQPLQYLVMLAVTALAFLLVEPFFYGQISTLITTRLVSGLLLIAVLVLLLKQLPSKNRGPLIAVVSVGLFLIGGTPLATPMLAIAMVMLLKTFGKPACFACIVVVTLTVFILHSTTGTPLSKAIGETLWIVAICLLYFLLASVLVALEQEREHSQQLALQVAQNAQHDRDLAVEAERTTAARMLHDGLGQQLVAVSMSLGLARNLQNNNANAAWEEVNHAKEVTDQALSNLRQWVRALDPPAIKVPADTAELEKSMVAISDAFASTGISFTIHSRGDTLPLNLKQGELLQVVAREGVSNALRHGNPTSIRFIVETHHDTVTLSVVNASVDPAPKEITTGYGLRSIEQRAVALGGTVSAGFTTNGFTLTVAIPVSIPAEAL